MAAAPASASTSPSPSPSLSDNSDTSPSPPKRAAAKSSPDSTPAPAPSDIGRITALDILRVLSGVLLLSCTLSYFVTAGDSILWGQRPWFSRAGVVRAWIRGPTLLTDAELTAYSGADPALPILLALNGSIYDVTAGRHFYGPGGGYHFFAGRDAARAFVTGCFDTDLTADLRGVEDMFVAVEEGDDDGGGGETSAERKNRRAKELREARRKVRDAVEGWQKVFRGETGKEYFEVGRVVREEGWLEREPRRELCERARKARPKRKKTETRKEE